MRAYALVLAALLVACAPEPAGDDLGPDGAGRYRHVLQCGPFRVHLRSNEPDPHHLPPITALGIRCRPLPRA